jgi:chloride channel protein, CIC family
MKNLASKILRNPLLRKYTSLVHEDLTATYSRDLHKWLIIAPIMGVLAGLLITLVAEIVLKWMWPPILRFYLRHPLAIVPGLAVGFLVAGLIMQYLTPDPDEHSTEEIIRSYHEHQGDIRMRPFVPKLLAAIATVGFGGSAALEGPSIYGGGAVGSWLWARLHKLRLGLDASDRRLMLISGAAAGMSAVFRAPLTGIIFALEMPYKDDLAHEALLPALIASVTSYATMAVFLGSQPLFNFITASSYTRRDLLWSALLGVLCGLATMTFDITFRRLRTFAVKLSAPHWLKMLVGGSLTGLCGLIFISIYKGSLIPLGANYEAVPQILQFAHSSRELVVFGVAKLAATLFTLGFGGVSAMFVPLFLTGGAFGTAFAQSVVHSPSLNLYAAVGMAAFIAGGYKTPLTAVVFVAEATGGHAYIVPVLIGAAVAYAVSGEASISGDQRLHEAVKVEELSKMTVRQVMQKSIVAAEAAATLREFADNIGSHYAHSAYPVYLDGQIAGTIAVASLSKVPAEKWPHARVIDLTDPDVKRVAPDYDLREALRLLMEQHGQHMLLVASAEGKLEGILTKTDILAALDARSARNKSSH